MNGFDITVLVLTGILVIIGLSKGLVRILIGIAALVVAFIVASQFHTTLAAVFDRDPGGPGAAASLAAYIAIFLGVMLLGGFVAFLMRRIVKAALLSWADRLAGGALGLLAAALASALLILPVVAYTPDGKEILTRSVLAPYVVTVADVFNQLAPDDLAERYRDGVRELRSRWQNKDLV